MERPLCIFVLLLFEIVLFFLVFHSDFENWRDHDFQLGRIQSNQFNRMECINIYWESAFIVMCKYNTILVDILCLREKKIRLCTLQITLSWSIIVLSITFRQIELANVLWISLEFYWMVVNVPLNSICACCKTDTKEFHLDRPI